MNESDLSEKFIEHLQSGNVSEFIDEMNSLVKSDLRNELLWLFLGRGYESVGDIEKAKNCYTSLRRLCKSSGKFENEIMTFFSDNSHDTVKLVNCTEPKFAAVLSIGQEIVKLPNGKTENTATIVVNEVPHKSVEMHKIQPPKVRIEPIKNVSTDSDLGTDRINDSLRHKLTAAIANKGDGVLKCDTPVSSDKISKDPLSAIIKYWNGDSGFGFVLLSDGRNAFLHFSNIVSGNEFYPEKNRLLTVRDITPSLKKSGQFDVGKATLLDQVSDIATFTTNFCKPLNTEKSIKPNIVNTNMINNVDGISSRIRHIVSLQQQKKYDEALKLIISNQKQKISQRDECSLLLIKAQIFSARMQFKEAENAYSELVEITERSPAKASHLEQLARMQMKNDKINDALKSAEDSLRISPNSLPTKNLVDQIKDAIAAEDAGYELSIDDIADDQAETISPMLKIDIEEFEYRDEQLSQKGKSSNSDVLRLENNLKVILDSKPPPTPERLFPLYLELSKAYNDLPIGSYDPSKLKEQLAFYSDLRGKAILKRFTSDYFSNTNLHTEMLQRNKDSACSYFIEALNLSTDERKILSILSDYLRLTMLFEAHSKSYKLPDKLNLAVFKDLYEFCIKHSDNEMQILAYKAIILCGAASINLWNRLSKIKGATSGIIYSLSKNKSSSYDLINQLEGTQFELTLKPGLFLRAIFENRWNIMTALANDARRAMNHSLAPQSINDVLNKWRDLAAYKKLFNNTEYFIFTEAEKSLKLMEPYLSRSSEERTNILYKTRISLETLISLIEEHPTYWGRIAFYPILKQWRRGIDNIEQERIKHILPNISVVADPPLLKPDGKDWSIYIVLHNDGTATAEGAILKYEYFDLKKTVELDSNTIEIESEIKSSGKLGQILLVSNESLGDNQAILFRVKVSAKYQNQKLEEKTFEFTLEKESSSLLDYDDLPWHETNIPTKELFKGRDKLIDLLQEHLRSSNRSLTYILYGLTRTGKSSILRYLSERIDLTPLNYKDNRTILTFSWDLSKAASQSNASDMWGYFLVNNIYDRIQNLINDKKLDSKALPPIKRLDSVRFKDWELVIKYFNENNFYPVFFIDEFSYFKNLLEKNKLDSSFLASIRSFAIEGYASFLFAGTYDLKELIKDPAYGVTGQLVNTKEIQVGRLDDLTSAKGLINVLDGKLEFTDEAVDKILILSNWIPYFIQIICKHCGYYAVENKKNYIGAPEVEFVIKILTGESPRMNGSMIDILAPGVFMNNQHSDQDPKPVAVLLSTICYFNKGNIDSRGIRYEEIQAFWGAKKIPGFSPLLADSITLLRDKGIILEESDENATAYKIGVDLFRRWWTKQHRNIEIELDSLKE